jgi:hypothetical protein
VLFFEPVALAVDVEGGGVVQQLVKDGGGEHVVLEDLAPVEELVAGDRSSAAPYLH